MNIAIIGYRDVYMCSHEELVKELASSEVQLTGIFDMWGGMMVPQNVFDHCAQTLRRRKLKLGDF